MHKLKNVSSTNSYATCDTPHPLQTNQPSLLHLGKHFTRSSNLTLPTPTPAFPPCHCLPHPPQHLRLPLPLHRPKRVLLRPPPSARERPQQRGGPERGPLVSIQGIAALLIPNMAHLLNPAAAPSPSSQLGDASSPQGGMGMGGSAAEFSPPGGGGAGGASEPQTPVFLYPEPRPLHSE